MLIANVRYGRPELLVTTDGTTRHSRGKEIGLAIPAERVHAFDPDTGAALIA